MLGYGQQQLNPLLGIGYALQSAGSALSGNPGYQQQGMQNLQFGMQMQEQQRKQQMLAEIIPQLPESMRPFAMAYPDQVIGMHLQNLQKQQGQQAMTGDVAALAQARDRQARMPTVNDPIRGQLVAHDWVGDAAGKLQSPEIQAAAGQQMIKTSMARPQQIQADMKTVFDAAGRNLGARNVNDATVQAGLSAGKLFLESPVKTDDGEKWHTLTPPEAAAEGLPAGGTYRRNLKNDKIEPIVPPRSESSPGRVKLGTLKSEAGSLLTALGRFRDVVKESDQWAFNSAYAGGATASGRRLNTAYNNAALMAKSEALFNLGVLNGPDLDIIRRTLPDPSTLGGAFTVSKDAYGAAIDEVENLIKSRIAQYETNLGGAEAGEAPLQVNFDWDYVPGKGLVSAR